MTPDPAAKVMSKVLTPEERAATRTLLMDGYARETPEEFLRLFFSTVLASTFPLLDTCDALESRAAAAEARATTAEAERDELAKVLLKAWKQWAGTYRKSQQESDDLFRSWKIHNVCGLSRSTFDALIAPPAKTENEA
jgi:hypothetical protein